MPSLVHVGGRLRRLGGWKAPPPQRLPRRMMSVAPDVAPIALPAEVDLRAAMPPVLNQGEVGDCATHAALTLREHLTLRAGHTLVRFSRFYGYARVREREHTALTVDSGSSVLDACGVIEDVGALPESLWADRDVDGKGWTLSPPPLLDDEAARHKAVLGFGLPGALEVKVSLAAGFPVAFGMPVTKAMTSDECERDGVIHVPQLPSEWTGDGHAMAFVGYSASKVIDGVAGAFRFENSWGDDWGEDGFGWLPFAFLERGWAEDFNTLRRAIG